MDANPDLQNSIENYSPVIGFWQAFGICQQTGGGGQQTQSTAKKGQGPSAGCIKHLKITVSFLQLFPGFRRIISLSFCAFYTPQTTFSPLTIHDRTPQGKLSALRGKATETSYIYL